MGKIHEFYLQTCYGKWGKLRLKDERILICRADCFCEDEDPETCEYIQDALLVECIDGTYEVLVNDDIEEIMK